MKETEKKPVVTETTHQTQTAPSTSPPIRPINLKKYPLQKKAHDYFESMKREHVMNQEDAWDMFVRRALNDKTQLDIKTVEEIIEVSNEKETNRRAMLDVQNDVIDGCTEPEEYRCERCYNKFVPLTWRLVRNGKIVMTKDKKEVRVGNFVVLKSENTGEYFMQHFCKSCLNHLRAIARENGRLFKSYPHDKAEEIIERYNRDLETIRTQAQNKGLKRWAKIDRFRSKQDSRQNQTP